MPQVLLSPEEGRREELPRHATHALIGVRAASFHNKGLVLGLSRKILRVATTHRLSLCGDAIPCVTEGRGAQDEATISTI